MSSVSKILTRVVNNNDLLDRRRDGSSIVRDGTDWFVVASIVDVIIRSTLIGAIHVGHTAKGAGAVEGFGVDENVANDVAATVVFTHQYAYSFRINVVHPPVPLVFSNGSDENRRTEVQRIDSVVLVIRGVPFGAIWIGDRANGRQLQKVDVVVHGCLKWVCSRLEKRLVNFLLVSALE